METPIYIALSRQTALTRQMDMVANNIANANTAGYKQQRMLFTEFLERPAMHEQLSLVQDRGMVRDLATGPLSATGNPFDLSLSGNGYFTVDTASGRRYTRNGNFRLNDQRQIVDGGGLPVLSDAGQPLVLPPNSTNFQVQADGSITVDIDGVAGADKTRPVGRLNVVTFKNEQGMREVGNGLYVSDQQPEPAPATTKVAQGLLEQSNVKPVIEMTSMIDITRQYQQNQNMLQSEHDRIRGMIQRLGRSA